MGGGEAHMNGALRFGWSSRTPLLLQSEAAECGLACLAMVAGHHGLHIDLGSLRARHGLSLKGATLADLVVLAGALKLSARSMKLEPEQLGRVQLPCVLHWDFNHFVVLTEVRRGHCTVHDPAHGERRCSSAELARHFTGIALELAPRHDFEVANQRRSLKLGALIGPLPGLRSAAVRIGAVAAVLQLLVLIAPFYLQWVVDQVLLAQDVDLLVVLAIGFGLLALLQAGVTALRGGLLMVVGTTLNLQMQSRLMQHLVRLPMAWFGKRHIGDVVSRFESASSIQRTLTGSLIETLIDGATALLTLGLMFFYAAPLAGVSAGAAALYAGLRAATHRPLRQATEEQIVRNARQHSHFLESVRGIQCIRLHAHEHSRVSAWRDLAVDHFNAALRTQRLALVHQSLQGLLLGLENVITVGLGAMLVLKTAEGSAFSVGMLFAFFAYKTQFMQRFNSLVDKGLELRMLRLHTDRIADVALQAAEPDDDAALPDDEPPIAAGAIALNHVGFAYAESDAPVLQDVSFSIAAGETVAIVGRSGGGKTTLVKLMLGLLAPTHGSITIDGMPLRQLGAARYRRAVASVMQDDQLFAGSIAENICFFEPQPDVARIERCARLAAVADDIAALPMRYHTLVGDQKQRILLARALYRRPRILFLDEATSHLDVMRERSVNAAIRALGITCVIVAHRPETIASADRVIALEGGRLGRDLKSAA
jgi:ATP-binding cassette, subfamily B, bacterial CvaB/MchF/RaxB